MDELFNWLQDNDRDLAINYARLSDEWRKKLTFPAYCVAQWVKLQKLREWRESMPDDRLTQLN